MKRKKNRVLSLVLALVVVCALVPAVSAPAEAGTGGRTQAEAVAWANSQIGKALDYDGAYGAQCVDLTDYYYVYLGQGVPWGNANQYVNGGHFTPSGWSYQSSPQPGDIAVTTAGVYGHVAIVTEIRGSQYVIVEQNYNYQQYCTTRVCNPGAFSTFIRPDFPPPAPPTPTGTEMTSGYDRTLPDGDYLIANAGTTDKTSFYFLDIVGTAQPAENGTNVQLYGPNADPPLADIWTLTYSGGFYTITQKGTNMALDVNGASREQGANVQVWPSHSGSAQKWAISSNGRNGYRIQAKVSGFSLDVSGGGTTAGTNIWQYSNNDSDAQSWFFIPYKPEQPIANGRYILLSASNTSFELDVEGDTGDIAGNANVQMWADTASSQFNSFDVVALDNGYYKLIHAASGKALDVAGGSSDNTANVRLHTDNGTIAQQWAITKNGSGYVLRARCSGLALDASGMQKGSNVQQYYYHGKANQTWLFAPAEYSVKYVVTDGANAPAPQTKYYKNSLTLLATGPSLSGYTFLGWTKTPSGTTVDYRPGASYNQDADLTLYPVFEPIPNPFIDVPSGSYYYDAVLWAVNHAPQITSGTTPTTFTPDGDCSRAQFVTFLWRANGSPEPKGNTSKFMDVQDQNAYYYKAVLWAVEQGVTSGTSATAFSPDRTCTRGEVVTFLHRAAGKPAPKNSQNPFTDVISGEFYYDAVLWAVERGVTQGTSATTFEPGQTCTRAQVVTFLYRDRNGK